MNGTADEFTGETIDHGNAGDACGVWVGDVEAGKRVTQEADGTWRVGPIDGPSEIELASDREILIAGRSLAGDRILFVAPEATGVSLLLLPATSPGAI